MAVFSLLRSQSLLVYPFLVDPFKNISPAKGSSAHPQLSITPRYIDMDQIMIIRQKNMALLRGYCGTIRELARNLLKEYWPEDRVQRMCKGQPISDPEARKIELLAGKAEGWMDVPHMELNAGIDEYRLLLAVRGLKRMGLPLVQKYVELLILQEEAFSSNH